MKHSIVLITLAVLALALSACKSEETKTVEWYLQPENKTTLETKLVECKNNPGELEKTPNCVNARRAYEKKFFRGKFEKVEESKIPLF